MKFYCRCLLCRMLYAISALLLGSAHSDSGASAKPRQPGQTLHIDTELGRIVLGLRFDVAPVTAAYIVEAVNQGLYDQGATFYRSDFVIQGGLHGTNVKHPRGDLPVNEAKIPPIVSNMPGTVAIAHWDVPDNGNTEFFINLDDNKHLDTVYGGYSVFAEVATDDKMSWETVGLIRAAIKGGTNRKVIIQRMRLKGDSGPAFGTDL